MSFIIYSSYFPVQLQQTWRVRVVSFPPAATVKRPTSAVLSHTVQLIGAAVWWKPGQLQGFPQPPQMNAQKGTSLRQSLLKSNANTTCVCTRAASGFSFTGIRITHVWTTLNAVKKCKFVTVLLLTCLYACLTFKIPNVMVFHTLVTSRSHYIRDGDFWTCYS